MADPPEIGMIVPKDGNAFEFCGPDLDCGLDELVDAKRAPSAKHTASRKSWLHTRKESRDVPVNFS
jgi:hypothetical protein